MAAATITTKILAETFSGMNTFRWNNTSAPLVAGQTWDLQIPIIQDTMSFTQADPTINKTLIYGQTKPLVIQLGATGDIDLSFTIPSVDDKTLSFVAARATGTPASVTDEVDGVAGSWIPVGKGISFSDVKKITGMCMIISEDKKKALVIKNLEGYATPLFDKTMATPYAWKIKVSLTGITTDTDGDVVVCDFTPTP